MEMQSRRIRRQPERTFVAEEMDFVPAPRQFLAQGGGQNAAAADAGITRDADFHLVFNHGWTRMNTDKNKILSLVLRLRYIRRRRFRLLRLR